nr:Rpn family recombination-promoting nuclease/putative transposase [Pedobacter cryoconitis]
MKEVFLIAVLDFKMKSSTDAHYLQSISLVNTGSGEIFHNGLGFKFLELPKFDKKEDELENELDKWVYMLKHMQSLRKIPEYLDKRIFQKIFNIAEMSRLTPEQRFIHDSDQQKKWEYQCVLDDHFEQGLEKGLEKGKLEISLELAREMKKENFDTLKIVQFTKLSIEVINNL